MTKHQSPPLAPAPTSFSGFCPIVPVPKGRPCFNSITRTTYTPNATREYENAVRSWMRNKYGMGTAPMDGSLCARYEFVCERPKSAPKKKIYSNTKPDIDNYIKAFQDALDFKTKSGDITLGVIANDSRISCLEAVKRYASDGEKPGTIFSFKKTLSQMMILSPGLTPTMREALSSTIPTIELDELGKMRKNTDAEHIFLVLAGEQNEEVHALVALIEEKFPNAKKLSVI